MSPPAKSPAEDFPASPVAAAPTAPYTGSMGGERIAVSTPWWQDVVRFWVPVLGIGGLVLFQMIGLQRQIGELHAEMTAQMATLRADLGERIARLETLMEVHLEAHQPDPPAGSGQGGAE